MKLKPCPFCGGEPRIERRGNARFSTIISCLDCGVTHECGDTGDSVGTGWNRRVADAARGSVSVPLDVARELLASLISLREAGVYVWPNHPMNPEEALRRALAAHEPSQRKETP